MSVKSIYNELQTIYLYVSLIDQDGNPVVPTEVTYRVDDVASGQNIVPDTVIYPTASEFTIRIAPDENYIVEQSNQFEERVVTVIAKYNTDQKTAEFRYLLRNLQFVS